MMTHTLILYFVMNGTMMTSKHKMPTAEECAIRATTFTMLPPVDRTFEPKHAECVSKEKKAPKPKAATLDLKRMA